MPLIRRQDAHADEQPGTGLQRLHAVEFDSLAQRQLLERGRTQFGADPIQSFIAVLRLSNLLAQRVVMVDSSLFDGVLFHRVGPRQLLRLAGRATNNRLEVAFPFEIMSRASTLEESLLLAVREPGSERRDQLRMYEFYSLDLPEPERVACGQRLSEVDVRELDRRVAKYGVTEGIARVLTECCDAPEEPVQRMRTAWEEWIAEDRSGRLELRVWPQMGRYDGDDDAFAWDPVDRMRRDIRTSLGRTGLEWVYENRHLRRTEIRSVLRTLLPEDEPELTADRKLIEDWFNACYMRALAYAHGAELIEFVLSGPDSDAAKRIRRRRWRGKKGTSRRVFLPPSLLIELGRMPRSVFDSVLYRNREAIRTWRATGDPQAMRRIAFGLLSAVEQPAPTSARRIITNFGLAMFIAIVVELFDNTPLWMKVAIAAAATVAASWQELLAETRLHGQLGAVIDVRASQPAVADEAEQEQELEGTALSWGE